MLKNLLLLIVLALLSACTTTLPSQSTAVEVSGKVTVHGAGVSGVEVEAWPLAAPALAGRAPYHSTPSGKEGNVELKLPPGEYYLLARGQELFSFYGRNPVTVPSAGLFNLKLGLVTLAPIPPPQNVGIESGVSGVISLDGRPLSGVVVYAYTDLSSRLKGMGYALSTPSDENGRFELSLPAGTYYLLARMRKDGGMVMGPLKPGDLIGYAPANPVRVAEGRVALVGIPLLEVPEKLDQLADSLFGNTSIKGRIVDAAGKPVSGARAILYDEPQMLNRPLYVSRPSAADGSFVLSFPSGGTYYLAARQQLGGAPAPGELYGTYDATPDHSLKLETGEQKSEITVTVEAMW
jgi:hypothetical protein